MSDPILKIGRVVEVSGSKVIGELAGTVEDLHRTYKSRRYTVGQVGSIVKIEAGDKLVFGVVTALRMTETLLYPDSLRKRKYLAKSFRKDSCCRHDLRGIFEHDGTGRADRVGSERLGRASSGSTRQRACTAGPGNELLGCRAALFLDGTRFGLGSGSTVKRELRVWPGSATRAATVI